MSTATTTAAHQAEADRVELVYYYALTQLGVHTIEDSLSLWQDISPAAQSAAANARWLRTATRLILKRRGKARDLALAYYRLTRALRIGRTIADPRRDEGASVSLEALRQQFERVVDEVAPEPAQNPLPDERAGGGGGTGTPEPVEAVREPQMAPGDDDPKVEIDTIEELEDEADRQEREAEAEAKLILDSLGPKNLTKKTGAIDDSQPADEVDQLRDEAHRKTGARVAAAAERISMNAARGFVYSIGRSDPRVIGWVRYSQTGTPCGWCAMLISRGLITYSSAEAAQHQGRGQEEDKYHDNCHCVAVPIFSTEQYTSSPLFALNREYDRLWQNGDKERGLRANPSLSQWRAYFRRTEKQRNTTTTAQAAA